MMKTKLFTLVFAVLVLGACKKEIKLDVKQIHLTDTTGQWDIKIDRPAFSTTDAETEKSCVKFNDEVNGLINGIHAAFIEQAKENIACLNSAGFKQAAPYELIIEDSVFLADQNYISVRVLSYEMLGGAHGMTDFYAINYDVKTQKFLTNKDILNLDKAADINALLKANLKDPDKCFTFEAPTVDNVTCINLYLCPIYPRSLLLWPHHHFHSQRKDEGYAGDQIMVRPVETDKTVITIITVLSVII